MRREKEQLESGVSYHTPPDADRIIFIRKGFPVNYEMLIKGAFDKVDSLGSSSAHRLFMKLADDMKPFSGNKLYIHFDALAAELGVDSKSIYRAFKLFLNADVIRRVKKGHYLIDPHILWCGYTQQRAVAIMEWEKGLLG